MSPDVLAVLGAVCVAVGATMAWWAVTGRRADGADADEADVRSVLLSEPTSGRVMVPMVRWLGERVTRWSPRQRVEAWQRRIDRAGLAGRWTSSMLLGIRVLAVVVLAIVFLIRFALSPSTSGALVLLAATTVGWLAPDLWLVHRGEQRRQQLLLAVPDTIDQLSVLVRAGLGIDAALARCARSDAGPLGRELDRVVQELRLGSTRRQALTDLVNRTGVADLRSVVTALTQAEDLGVPVSDTLRQQADEVRDRRRQRAAEHAMKLPVKILLPLVVCIFPVLLIVLLGPAVLTIMDELGG